MRDAIVAALQKGDLITAERLCFAGLTGGTVGEALYMLGAVRSKQADHHGAHSLFYAAEVLLPTRADVAYNHGVALRDAGDGQAAINAWQRAVALNPNHVDAWRSMGMRLMESKQWDLAHGMFKEVLQRQPEDLDSLMQMGILHYMRGELKEAEAFNLRLLTLTPDDVNVWINLAETLKDQGRYDDALTCLRRAMALDSTAAIARFHYGCLLLSLGQWQQGFALYEWRHTKLQHMPVTLHDTLEWSGQEPVGTRVVIWNDQGNGDVLHFLRFVSAVVARGHHVTLIMPEPILRLAQSIQGVAKILPHGVTPPPCDAQIALSSLPMALQVSDPVSTWRGPYLTAPPAAKPLKRPGRLAVGLVWAGEPTYIRDAERSLALSTLEPLLGVEGVDWFGLQVGPARDQIAETRWNGVLHDLGGSVSDFADTGSLLQELDLFITVDTGVGHLAGALQRPTWLLLRDHGDWRWQFEGETTGWYPAHRLFRQPTAGDWASVIEAVKAALSLAVHSSERV